MTRPGADRTVGVPEACRAACCPRIVNVTENGTNSYAAGYPT